MYDAGFNDSLKEVNKILIRADLVKIAYPSVMRGITIIKFTDNTKSEFEMDYDEFIKAFKKAFNNGACLDV